ncbi:tetratricopeptide repeat protein [Streptomyces sp. ACA25]|uniref:tetratricopeptide repeat protein n=1 Tax=Streptomyces sp. ACA25 TaxID=3022596 RepID=UPI002308196A|nr:tetratricopeptide repeat protein [Streptomyces sp. ACA25]MDB1090227.1 tetratricopeptide repeat protein [Streptomyces sp. ACA25]
MPASQQLLLSLDAYVLEAGTGLLSFFGLRNATAAIGAATLFAAALAAAVVVIPRNRRQRRPPGAGADLLGGLPNPRESVSGCLVLSDGQLPKVHQLDDPVQLGVHRAIPPGDGEPPPDGPPAYVPRDREHRHREQLQDAGFTLLIGHSTAGKSRLAYENMRAAVPGHTLIAPRERSKVGPAVEHALELRDAVLWLDGLEHYLGNGGLTREHVDKLLDGTDHHRLIIATIRSTAHAELTGGNVHDARAALEPAREIRLEQKFSPSELRRAIARDTDPRIKAALVSADRHGIAESLAAGPELLKDYENAWQPGANPRGAALVTAALDCDRAGLVTPSRTLLEEIHEHYLRARGGPRLDPESLDAAWAWATRVRRGATALLTPTPDGRNVSAFDYLLDARQRELGRGRYVADEIITALLPSADRTVALAIGHTAYWHSALTTAERAFERARALCENDEDLRGQAAAHQGLGATAKTRGHQDEAMRSYERALEMFEDTGDRHGQADVLVDIGDLCADSGDLDRAMDTYEQARELHRAAGHRPGEADVLVGMATVAKQLEEYQPALRMYEQALAFQQELGDRAAQAGTLRKMADVAIDEQADDRATHLLHQALRLSQQNRDHTGTVHTLVKLGSFALARNDIGQAARSFEAARSLAEEAEFSIGVLQALGGLAAVAEAQGDYDRAFRLSERLLAMARETRQLSVQVVALSDLGNIARARGDYRQAVQRYEEAREVCRESGSRHSEAVIICSLALTAEEEGRRGDARTGLLEARRIFAEFDDMRWMELCNEALEGLDDF